MIAGKIHTAPRCHVVEKYSAEKKSIDAVEPTSSLSRSCNRRVYMRTVGGRLNVMLYCKQSLKPRTVHPQPNQLFITNPEEHLVNSTWFTGRAASLLLPALLLVHILVTAVGIEFSPFTSNCWQSRDEAPQSQRTFSFSLIFKLSLFFACRFLHIFFIFLLLLFLLLSPC